MLCWSAPVWHVFFWEHILVRTSLPWCLRKWCLYPATLLPAALVPNVFVMYFSNLGFPLLLFPATIPSIIVFSKPLCRVTWPKYLSVWRLTELYSQFIDRWSSFLRYWGVGSMSYPGYTEYFAVAFHLKCIYSIDIQFAQYSVLMFHTHIKQLGLYMFASLSVSICTAWGYT